MIGAPTRSCTELASIPKKCIAQNALGAVKLASLTGFAPVISCMRGRRADWTTPQGRNGEGRRNRTFDLMHVTHPLWLAELCPQKWWGRRVLPSLPLACQTSALLMSYAPKNGAGERSRTVVSALARPHSAVEPHPRNGVPSRALTDNLTLRTRPLCALSYGDEDSNPWPVSSTGSHPSLSGSAGPLELLRVQEFEYGTRVR